MKDNFLPGIDYIVANYEGGFSNNKKDPGGATYQGVTQRTYDGYRIAHKKPIQSVRYMDIQERTDLYRGGFWNQIKGDFAPSGVDFVLLDTSIHSSPAEATEILQKALGLPADGHFGPATSAALLAVTDYQALIRTMCSLRLSFLQNLGTWQYFSSGWRRRVEDVQRVALSAYNLGAIKMVKAVKITPKEKKLLDGAGTILVGLITACLPSALSYLAGVDWNHYLGANGAFFVSGAVMVFLRMLQNTDTKVGAKL